MNFATPLFVTNLFLCISWFATCSVGVEQFMSGAVPIKEPDNHYPIMYSSVIPLIYKFHLPVWDLSTMKIQFWKEHNNCTESDNYEAGYPCPIMYHMNTLLEAFASNITHWENIFLPKESLGQVSGEFLHDPSILWNKDVCTSLKIEPHFQEMHATSQQIQKYVEVLTQCAEKNGNVYNKKVINMTDAAIKLENQYHDTFTSFTADYWKKLTTSSREATSLIAWTALETALMIHQYSETQKWTHAMESCKSQKLPWSLIDMESLNETLTSLRMHYLEDESLDYAIAMENLLKYYKLPLTDCVFGDDNTLVVRIMVPVVPKEARSQNHFVRFHPIPFIAEGKVCTLWNNKESIPFNLGLNGVIPCTCSKSEQFCKGWIAESDERCLSVEQRNQELCIHALTSDIENDIIEHCKLGCKNIQPNALKFLDMIVKSDSTNIVKIIPAPNASSTKNFTFVQCPGLAMEVHWENEGAYELTIPDDCNLIQVESKNGSFANIVPEIYGVSIKYLMPYHWRNGITIDSSSSPSSNSNKNVDEAVVNIIERMNGVEPKITYLASKVQQVTEQCSESNSNLILWLLVIISLLTNLVLGVMMIRLNKWTKDIKIKSDRMVYNVSSEDDFPIQDQNMRNPLCPTNRISRNSNAL